MPTAYCVNCSDLIFDSRQSICSRCDLSYTPKKRFDLQIFRQHPVLCLFFFLSVLLDIGFFYKVSFGLACNNPLLCMIGLICAAGSYSSFSIFKGERVGSGRKIMLLTPTVARLYLWWKVLTSSAQTFSLVTWTKFLLILLSPLLSVGSCLVYAAVWIGSIGFMGWGAWHFFTVSNFGPKD